MIEYQKENEISFQDILNKKEYFQKILDYETLINTSHHSSISILAITSITSLIITFLISSLMTYLGSNIGVDKTIAMFVVIGFLTILTAAIFENYGKNLFIYQFYEDFQINKINEQILLENKKLPDIEQEKHDYYTYIIQKEARFCLIKEIDNILLRATHYQVKNEYTSNLESLKTEYLTFNLESHTAYLFYNLHNDIISNIQHVNNSIQQLSNNQFYTEYLNIDSEKTPNQIKSGAIFEKYKGIL